MQDLDDKQISRLKQLLTLLEPDQLTKKDFVDSFQRVVNLVMKIQEQQGEAITKLQETYNNLINRIKGEHSESLTSLKKGVNELFVGDRLKEMDGEMKGSFTKLQGAIDEKIRKAEAITEALRNESLRAVNAARSAESSSASSSARIAEAANSVRNIQEVRKLIIDELKKIKDELDSVKRARTGRPMGRAKVQIIRAVDLTSQVDGSTSAFTLPPDTVGVLGVWGTQFPVTFRQDVDWTFSGRTLTLETAQVGIPQSGQTLWVLADVLFYP